MLKSNQHPAAMAETGAANEDVGRFVLHTLDRVFFSKSFDSDDPAVARLMDLLEDEGRELYTRGLAARGLGGICLKVKGAKAKVLRSERWGVLVDALLDVIGLCNQAGKARRSLVEVDLQRVRTNCCLLLSLLMDESVATLHKNTARGPASPSMRRKLPRSPAPSASGGAVVSEGELLVQWQAMRMEAKPARLIIKAKPKDEPPAPAVANTDEPAAAAAPPPSSAEATAPAPSLPVPSSSSLASSTTPAAPASQPPSSMGGDLMKRVKRAMKDSPPSAPPPAPPRPRHRGGAGEPRRAWGAGPGGRTQPPATSAPSTALHRRSPVRRRPPPASAIELAPLSVIPVSTSPSQPGPSSPTFSSVDTIDYHQARGNLLGFVYQRDGRAVPQLVRNPQHAPRPSVIFGEDLPADPSWAPGVRRDDFLEKDRRLGYQVPRLWFPVSLKDEDRAPHMISVPDPRPGSRETALHPPSSTLLEKEHHELLAHYNYHAIHQMSRADPTFSSAFDHDTWQRLVQAFARNADTAAFGHVWTPRRGRRPHAHSASPTRPSARSSTPASGRQASVTRKRPRSASADSPSAALRGGGSARPSSAYHAGADDVARLMLRRAAEARQSRVEKREARAALEAKAELKRVRLRSMLAGPGGGGGDDRDLLHVDAAAQSKAEQEVVGRVLGEELEAVKQHAELLQDQMLRRIERSKACMPWTSLMLFEGGPAMVRRRLTRVIELWGREFTRSQLALAVAVWRVHTAALRYAKDTRKYFHIAGRDKFLSAFRRVLLRRKASALEKLVYKVAWLIWEERQEAALKIQRQYHRWKGYKRFLLMHDVCIIDGPLADVPLDRPRPGLPFHIDHRVRLERRRLWLAAVTVQKEFRKQRHRKLFFRMLRAVVVLQSYLRMWSDRRAFLYLRRLVVRLQSHARMLMHLWRYRVYKEKALVLQRYMRAHLGRGQYYRLKYLTRRHRGEALHVHALHIQRLYRGYRGRQAVEGVRLHRQQRQSAALRLQVAWYTYKKQFPTFLLLSGLRDQDRHDAEMVANVRRRNRYFNARKIQRCYRARLHHRRESAAVRLQCWFRGLLGYDLLSILRRERWASRKIRHWGIVMLRKRDRASLRIALWWFRLKPGRLLRHLETWARREEEAEEAVEREERDHAATVIQAIVHGIWTRREIREMKHILNIQRVARGFLGRRRALRRLREVQHHGVTRYVIALTKKAVYEQARRVYVLRVKASTAIQRCYRGHLTRAVLAQARSWARRQVLMAIRIQRAWRAHVRVMAAFMAFTARQREAHNPYRHVHSAAAVVRQAMRTGLKEYHPENEQVGMRLPSWLRRVGAPEIAPLLKAAKVDRLEQLRKSDDGRMQRRLGIDEKVAKGVRTGVFEAPALRSLMLTMLRMLDIPPKLRTLRMREVYDGFRLLEEPRTAALRQLFLGEYGERLVVRADAFAAEVGGGPSSSLPLTLLQLRRFFRMHPSASKAKDGQGDLLSFPEERSEAAHELRRVLQAIALLQDGAERVADLLPSSLLLGPRLQAVKRQYIRLLTFRRFRAPFTSRPEAAARGGGKQQKKLRPPTPPVSRELLRMAWRHCRSLYVVLDEVWDMHLSACLLAKRFRRYLRAKHEAAERHQDAAARIYHKYLEEQSTNYVMLHWEAERREERLRADQLAREMALAKRKAEVEEALKHVLPFGWERAWKAGEQENQQDEGHYVYRLTDSKGKVKEERTERPCYGYAEDRATWLITEYMRANVVKQKLLRLRRARRKKALEERQKKVWASKAVERSRAVTVRLSVVTRVGRRHFLSDAAMAMREQDEAKALEDRVALLLDEGADMKLGLPVHARFGGLAYSYPGTIYQVNPTQYVTREGLRTYPKGTYGVLYDDGDYEPAVPKKLIRVLRLKVGMRVEARYQGGEVFYPGKVAGVNEREGVALSYRVVYDDGEDEKAVRRHMIRIVEAEAAPLNRRLDRMLQAYEEGRAWRAEKNARMREERGAWEAGVQQLIDRFDAAWRPDLHPSNPPGKSEPRRAGARSPVRASDAGSSSPKAGAGKAREGGNKRGRGPASPAAAGVGRELPPWEAKLKQVSDMVGLSLQLADLRRRRAGVQLRIEYTRMQIPFGWVKRVDPATKAEYYELLSTGQRRRQAPSYTHVDDVAARRVQAAWRGFMGKRKFAKLLEDENPVSVAKTAIREASKAAWVGVGEEGITLEMWLTRLGLRHVWLVLAPRGPSLTLDKLRRLGDEELKSLGVAAPADRRVVSQMLQHDPGVLEGFRLLNYYVGTSDPRTLRQCIEDSRAQLYGLLLKAYPGNTTRVERIADGIALSRFPVSHAQLQAFIRKYAGKAAAASDNLDDIVDVRTTSCLADERRAYEVYKRCCQRLCTLLANLPVNSLRDLVRSALADAEAAIVSYHAAEEAAARAEAGEQQDEEEEGLQLAKAALAGFKKAAAATTLSPRGKPVNKEGSVSSHGTASTGTTAKASNATASSSSAVATKDRSGAEGKAAYILRLRAIEKVLRFDRATRTVQTVFRGHRARQLLRTLMTARLRFIVLHQSLWRRYKVRCLRAYMVEQQQSEWEQLWSHDEKCFYYYNKRSGESQWEEPGVPYRPLVRDSYTGKLVQAWPYLDMPPPSQKKAARGACMRCLTKEASRRCNTCSLPATRQDWNKGYAYYCFGCYADVHKDDPALREHGFTVIKSASPPPLKCSVCAGMAVRRCLGIRVEAHHRERLAKIVLQAGMADHRQPLDDFCRMFREVLRLEYSHKKIEFIYSECGGSSVLPGTLWGRVRDVLDDHQEVCGENYCARCWSDSHKRGQRAKHSWAGFAAGWSSCVSCEREPADRLCEECDDKLCEACFKANHVKGRKRKHTWSVLKEPLDEAQHQVCCECCQRRVGALECADCREWFCDSCLAFRHPRECEAKRASEQMQLRPPEDDGLEEHPTACVVCGKPPDTLCADCGDVYCSNKWMGNPGCFVKMHRKGNRKRHVKRPYTYCKELEAAQEAQRRREEEEQERLAARRASVDQRVHDFLLKKQEMRRRRLEEEARAEFQKMWEEKRRLAQLTSAIMGGGGRKSPN